MVVKAKKIKRATDKKPKTKKKVETVEQHEIVLDEEKKTSGNSEEFYVNQIKSLEDVLGKYQKKCDQLEILLAKCNGQYGSILAEKKDIVNFLKKELDDKDDQLIDFTNRIKTLQNENTNQKTGYDSLILSLKQTYEEREHEFKAEITSLSSKIHSLEKYAYEKEEHEKKMSSLQAAYDGLIEKHKVDIYNLEKLHLIDKYNRKNEIKEKLNNLSSEFRHLFQNQMSDTMKKLINENNLLYLKMKKLIAIANGLIKTNQILKEKDLKNRVDLETLEQLNLELANKSAKSSDVAHKLLNNFDYEDKDEIIEDLNVRISSLSEELYKTNEELNEQKRQSIEKDNVLKQNGEYVARLNEFNHELRKVVKNIRSEVTDALSNNRLEYESPKLKELYKQMLMIVKGNESTVVDKSFRNHHPKNVHRTQLGILNQNKIELNKKNNKDRSVHSIFKKDASTQTTVLETKYFTVL